MKSAFHLAYHVTDLNEARMFYGEVLGCTEGRSTETWVDFDFFGHQISLHLGPPFETTNTGKVGDHMVPMPHLGLVLGLDNWRSVAERLERAGIAFEIAPQVRFEGQPGEQHIMFFRDPSGNPIEMKGFAKAEKVFEAD
ncbi:MAG: VOC family protein [Pseudomonadota bacterium]